MKEEIYFEEIITEIKGLPFVQKIIRHKDGVFIYGKENPRMGVFRKETFIPKPRFHEENTLDFAKEIMIDFLFSAERMYGCKAGLQNNLWNNECIKFRRKLVLTD